MIIGFTQKTSKILPRIFCKKFRHCAIILEHNKHRYIMIQIRLGNIQLIPLKKRDLKILAQHGWVFLEHKAQGTGHRLEIKQHLCLIPYDLCHNTTCVSFAKYVIGIHAPFIWTPYQLYKYLK